MFQKPSALANLKNKAQQYNQLIQTLTETPTPTERAKWKEFECKQCHQLIEARNKYVQEALENE